jgi:uncharacterized phage protein (TIGR02218 family)
MKAVDPNLQAHLAAGLTTLCYCWRLTLASGERLGFTDHDVALAFDGTSFEAQAGFSASEIQSALGLAVDNLEAKGALSSAQISEARIAAGEFDDAAIEVWLVNWQDPSQRLLQRKGNLGEITRGAGAFTAEVRGLAHLMNQQRGRLYHYGCDAVFGDGRCKADTGANTAAANVVSVAGASLMLSGLGQFASGWFTRGQLLLPGHTLDIKRHITLATAAQIDLWEAPKFAIAPGAAVAVVAGCDKQLSTCQGKFNNAVNFRGFPHMPGNDFVARVAAESDPNNNGQEI